MFPMGFTELFLECLQAGGGATCWENTSRESWRFLMFSSKWRWRQDRNVDISSLVISPHCDAASMSSQKITRFWRRRVPRRTSQVLVHVPTGREKKQDWLNYVSWFMEERSVKKKTHSGFSFSSFHQHSHKTVLSLNLRSFIPLVISAV